MLKSQTAQNLMLKIFQGRLDYKNRPRLLDIAQNSANELAQYIKAKEIAKDIFKGKINLAIDFCCGTGLFTIHILSSVKIKKVILVDNDKRFLNFTKRRLQHCRNCEFILADALEYKSKQKADLILLGSAYHHIKDNDKIKFLKNIEENLSLNGWVIMNEHFIPPYKNYKEYQKGILTFYSKLIDYLTLIGTDSTVIRIIKQVAYYGYNHDYEYKNSFEIFKEHLRHTNLSICKKHRVWPENDGVFKNEDVGSFVLLIKKGVK